jgi:two-component system chemotaxis response regulator CheY
VFVDAQQAAGYIVVIYGTDLQWRQILARELHAAGFGQVTQAATAKEALQAVRDNHADAIVVPHDLKLIKFLRTHRASPDKRIVIILMTANLRTADIARERDSGVNEIVAKPASVEQVISHLFGALSLPRRFIDARRYHGPDRRRHNRPYKKQERRGTGQVAVSDED